MQNKHAMNNYSLLQCTMTIETSGSFIASARTASYGAHKTPF